MHCGTSSGLDIIIGKQVLLGDRLPGLVQIIITPLLSNTYVRSLMSVGGYTSSESTQWHLQSVWFVTYQLTVWLVIFQDSMYYGAPSGLDILISSSNNKGWTTHPTCSQLRDVNGVKISQVIYLSNLNIYSNFTLFLFLSWYSLSKHSSTTVISGFLFCSLFSNLFQTQLQCFFQNTEVSISYLTYLSSDSLLLWHSYYLCR